MKLTSKEMEERKAKGLCFWCDEKYTMGHKCKKKQLFSVEMLGEEEKGVQEEFNSLEEDASNLN